MNKSEAAKLITLIKSAHDALEIAAPEAEQLSVAAGNGREAWGAIQKENPPYDAELQSDLLGFCDSALAALGGIIERNRLANYPSAVRDSLEEARKKLSDAAGILRPTSLLVIPDSE